MSPQRQPGIDALKVLASQTIVWHHLSAYGPVSAALRQIAPQLANWLFDYGRMAVQVFLVLGGYLAVQHLTTTMTGGVGQLARSLWRRYLRLVPPLLLALMLTVAAAAVTAPWLSPDLVTPRPALSQWTAHTLLLQEVLQIAPLSAGIWYVAIDFQLHALLALLLWLGQRGGDVRHAQALVLLVAAGSLLLWNRDPGLDDWSLYFFGSYCLGVLARWSGHGRPPDRQSRLWLVLLLVLGALALLLEYRTRIALALTVALFLALDQRQNWSQTWPEWLCRTLAWLSRSSYALFLVHFPVLLLGNAALVFFGLWSTTGSLAVVLAIWLVSIALGWAFERWVEAPLGRWL